MSFSFETTVPVRYSDVDSYGHVNNAVYATYLEEARVDYFKEVVGLSAADIVDSEGDVGVVVAGLELEYERPISGVDAVAVGVTVPRLGTRSFPVEYEVRADGTVAATGETTMVAYDRAAGESTAIPAAWRDAIAAYEGIADGD